METQLKLPLNRTISRGTIEELLESIPDHALLEAEIFGSVPADARGLEVVLESSWTATISHTARVNLAVVAKNALEELLRATPKNVEFRVEQFIIDRDGRRSQIEGDSNAITLLATWS